MHNLRIALINEKKDEVASICGDKIQVRWEEYHHEDEDECSSEIFTIEEILNLIQNRTKFYNEEAIKAIKEAEDRTKEAYKKLHSTDDENRKLNKEVEVLKEALKIIKGA